MQVRRQIDSVLEARYGTGRAAGRDNAIHPIFPTGMRRPQGEAIAAIVRQESAARTIETGFALGLSGLYMIGAALEVDAASAAHCAMDPGETPGWQDAGLVAFEEAGALDRLEFFHEPSEYVLPRLIARNEQYGLGLIDGGHYFESVVMDIALMSRVVRPGGLLLLDDTWMPSVRTAVRFFIENCELEPLVDLGDDPRDWPGSRRGLRRRHRNTRGWSMVALRLPKIRQSRHWEHFVEFSVG